MTTTLNVVESASGEVGVIVAVLLAVSYEIVSGTEAVPFLSSSVDVVSVLSFIGSLKWTATAVDVGAPVTPLAGDTLVTVGGVRSSAVVAKTTSTQ